LHPKRKRKREADFEGKDLAKYQLPLDKHVGWCYDAKMMILCHRDCG